MISTIKRFIARHIVADCPPQLEACESCRVFDCVFPCTFITEMYLPSPSFSSEHETESPPKGHLGQEVPDCDIKGRS
jgi:hypothetical protein